MLPSPRSEQSHKQIFPVTNNVSSRRNADKIEKQEGDEKRETSLSLLLRQSVDSAPALDPDASWLSFEHCECHGGVQSQQGEADAGDEEVDPMPVIHPLCDSKGRVQSCPMRR